MLHNILIIFKMRKLQAVENCLYFRNSLIGNSSHIIRFTTPNTLLRSDYQDHVAQPNTFHLVNTKDRLVSST